MILISAFCLKVSAASRFTEKNTAFHRGCSSYVFVLMSCPSLLRDFSPALHVASLANERVPRGCQEPIVENNKMEHVTDTKIGCAMVNMDKGAQSTPAAATDTKPASQTCNRIDTSSKEVASRSLPLHNPSFQDRRIRTSVV